jgi:arginase
MPALKYHVPGGPRAADVAALFRALRGHDIVAVSVSAWHGERDDGDRTARACLDILEALLAD